jgi:NADPH2:quinone reductase
MPFTLGGGFVGIIAALPTEQSTRTILPPLELGMEVFSMQGGAFAEYAVAPAFQVAPLPDGICPQEGVHMTIPAITAMYLTKESYAIKKGDWALVRSAGGGVGLLLVQVSVFIATLALNVGELEC